MAMNRLTIAKIVLVIVIVIILIFIVHVILIKKTKGGGGRIVVFDVFVLTKGPKTKSNRFYGQGSHDCFYVNGIEAPVIKVNRGAYYEFKNETDEPLYFTTSHEGGGAGQSVAKWYNHNKAANDDKTKKKKSKKEQKLEEQNILGFANGTIFFEITDTLPETFYYQSARDKHMGSGVVLV